MEAVRDVFHTRHSSRIFLTADQFEQITIVFFLASLTVLSAHYFFDASTGMLPCVFAIGVAFWNIIYVLVFAAIIVRYTPTDKPKKR